MRRGLVSAAAPSYARAYDQVRSREK